MTSVPSEKGPIESFYEGGGCEKDTCEKQMSFRLVGVSLKERLSFNTDSRCDECPIYQCYFSLLKGHIRNIFAKFIDSIWILCCKSILK